MIGKVLSVLMLSAAAVAVTSANDQSSRVLIGDIIKDEVRLCAVGLLRRFICQVTN